jgi:hypothetical protein
MKHDPTITVDVRRAGGQVTRLQGDQAIAVAAKIPPVGAPLSEITPGVVSIRCTDERGLALCLASILAAVASESPETIMVAVSLAERMNARNPEVRRELPDHGSES